MTDSTLAYINKDKLIQKLSNARRESFNNNIPANLLIINKITVNQKLAVSTGFRYLFNSNFKPYLFSNVEYKLSKTMVGDLHIGYGGYSRLNVGLTFAYMNDNWYLKIGSNSLQGFIAPKKTFGQGLFFALARKFKN